ncbi:MAG: DUF222 domain-containing protein [Actinomycetota bacterium]
MEAITETSWVPKDLDEMEPGILLGSMLESIDVSTLSGHDRVIVLRARQRMASHLQAQIYADMASIADITVASGDDRYDAPDAAAMEVRAALRLTRMTADLEMRHAINLRDRFPEVWDRFNSGILDARRVRVIIRGTEHLAGDIAQRVIDQVLDDAHKLTTGQLRATITKLALDAEPETAVDNYEAALADRRVFTEPNAMGTANLLGLDLPPHRVAAATRRINRLARSLRGGSEDRTMDQLRADVLLDLLLGKSTRGKGAVVHLHTDIETLTRLNEDSGEVNGYGPVIADIARQVAKEQDKAEWRFSVSHPETGQPIAEGTTRRRPTAAVRRAVEMRDRTCVFPGCRVPATDCDLDHITPWSEGGRTGDKDLAPDCRPDHVGRHKGPWTYHRLPNGDYLWRSPLGHRYTTSGNDPP